MQVQGCQASREQRDFAPGAVAETEHTQVVLSGAAGAASKKEDKETYEPTEEGLLLYMEMVKSEMNDVDAQREVMNEELKVLKIAHNIMRGMTVPAKDESFLMSKNYKLYMAAKNVGLMRQTGERAKSVLGKEDTGGKRVPSETGGQGGSIAAADFLPGAGESAVGTVASGTETKNASSQLGAFPSDSSLFGVSTERRWNVSVSKASKKKTRKRLFYNFKDVSAKILSAKTSGSARRVLSTARQKTALLRKKMKSGEYDEKAVQLALIHAEAMERVAKKKVKHLQEEEAAKRGGPCAGDNDREQIQEQMRQDEQMMLEKQAQEPSYAAGTQQPMEGMPVEDVSMEELMADALQAQMLDLTDVMDEFVEEFSELMMDSMEEISSMEELADELMGASAEPDMDPEDLKALKLKHRTKEQKEIAEADSKYLKAFFQKLQREQQAVTSNAAKAVAAMASDSRGGIVSLTGASAGGRSGSGASTASSASKAASTGQSAAMETAIAADTVKASASDLGMSVSTGEAVAAVATGACIDVAI